jgi:hypothetical protein
MLSTSHNNIYRMHGGSYAVLVAIKSTSRNFDDIGFYSKSIS